MIWAERSASGISVLSGEDAGTDSQMPVYCWKEDRSMWAQREPEVSEEKRGANRKENAWLYSRCWDSNAKWKHPKGGRENGGSLPDQVQGLAAHSMRTSRLPSLPGAPTTGRRDPAPLLRARRAIPKTSRFFTLVFTKMRVKFPK